MQGPLPGQGGLKQVLGLGQGQGRGRGLMWVHRLEQRLVLELERLQQHSSQADQAGIKIQDSDDTSAAGARCGVVGHDAVGHKQGSRMCYMHLREG